MTHSNAPHASRRTRRRLMTGGAVGLAISALMLAPQARAQVSPPVGTAFQGTPQVVSGGASIVQTPTVDTIRVTTPQVVINWTPNDRNGTGAIDFLPSGLRGQFLGDADFTVLNRIIPLNGQDVPVARMIALNGLISSSIGTSGQPGGSVWFYSPGGILVGNSAVINVGSLLLTSRDIDTTGGLFGSTGEIRFRNPAIAGALGAVEIAPGAQINARAAVTGSAYIAVVAPSIIQAGTIRADGSVALVAAEQADIRINQGLFDINVLVGTSDPHGIIHTGTTGGPSDNSNTYESRAYLVAVPKNQAITMLLSGTIGFETASSVSIASNGGIVLSAGHNIAGGVAADRVLGTTAEGNISITDSSFRNNLDATASGSINARPNSSCQPSCSATGPNGQLLFNGNATLNGATGVSLSIGQAQRIIVNGNLSLLSATPSQGGSASLTIDNVSPPSSSSGSGIASITGALLIDASARGNLASESGQAVGGTASLSINNGSLSAAAISVLADGTGVLAGSTTGGDGTGGSASLTIQNSGSVSTSGLLRVSADGRGGGVGFDAAQNPALPAIGGNGRGGSATLTIDNAVLSGNSTSVSASGFGAAGTTTSGNGVGGTAAVAVDNNGSTTRLSSGALFVQARGQGGGSGFDPVSQQFTSTADGGNGTGGRASLTVTDTTPRDVNILLAVVDAGASGGVAQSSSQTPALAAGGDAQGGTASYIMNGTSSAATIEQLTVASVAQGGSGIGTLGRGGNATGGTSTLSLTSGATLTNSNSQSTFGGSRLNADGFGGVGQDRSGNGSGGTASASVAAGARIDTDVIFLTASGIGGGGSEYQSFSPVTTIGGNGSGGTVSLTSGGTIVSSGIELDANGFGGSSNPGSGAVSVSTGGSAVGGSARINLTGGSIGADGVSIRANATAGGSATEAGTSGASLGGTSLLFQTGGTFTVTGNLSVEARGYVRSGQGRQLTQTGGSAGIGVSGGVLDVDGTISIDASAGLLNFSSDATQAMAITGGSTSLDATNNATVTAVSLLLFANANGGIDFGDENSGIGASATGGTSKLRSASGGSITVEDEFRIDASGTGGFAARGGSGTGGSIDLEIDGGALTLPSRAQLNAGGVSGVSFGTSGSTSATGGSVTITVSNSADSAFEFGTLAVAATAESGQLFAPAARGGPAPVVASDAFGGTVVVQVAGGAVTGNQLNISADAYGSAGGDGMGGAVRFDQGGGTVQVSGISLTADGFGGSSPPGIEDGNGPVIGGDGRGGTAGVALVGGSISTSFLSASASGRGGTGYTPFATNGEGGFGNGEGAQLFPGDGGDGYGGVIDVLIDGTASVGIGSAFFNAFGRGGEGGGFNSDGTVPILTPGRGGGGFGGSVFVDLAGGDLLGTNIFASAGGIGGDGGRIFNINGPNGEGGFAGSADDPQPIGGNANGGTATIRLAAEYASATLSADATAGAGEGGTALAGARGGSAKGGFASIIVDGVDAGSIGISISAEGFGGQGGRPLHGDGGDGGDGAGGTARFEIANDGTASLSDISVSTSGYGGSGRAAVINEFFPAVATGFDGGDGGNGFGGTIEVAVTDADLALSAGNGEGIIIESFGFGGFGGDGADNDSGSPTVATFGGRGGNGGNGIGGGITLAAAGGTLTTDDGQSILLTATGTSGSGGNGGFGNAVTTVNPMTGVSTTQGGDGFAGFTGLEFGGLVRLEAHDTESGAGLIDLPSAFIDASGQLGGRVELIDDTAGTGIVFGNLSISTDGGALIGEDFSLIGSGIYVRSRDGAITVADSLSLTVGGTFQIDAFDTGGLFVGGQFDLNASVDIVARHEGRAEGATISANAINFNASSINLQSGTLVESRFGQLSLSAINSIVFGKLSAPNGSILLIAGGDIFGDEATAGNEIVGNAEGNITVNRLTTTGMGSGGGQTSSAPSPANIRLSAGNDVTLGTLTAADNIFIDANNLQQQGGGESGGPSSLTAGGIIEIDVDGDARFGSADGASIDIEAGGNVAFDATSSRFETLIAAGAGITGGSITTDRGDALLAAGGSVLLGTAAIGGSLDIDSGGDVDLIDQVDVAGNANIAASGMISVAGFTASGSTATSSSGVFGGNIRLDAGGAVNLTGTMLASGDVDIDSGSVNGGGSSIIAGGNINIDVTGTANFGSAEADFVEVDADDDIVFGSISARSGVELDAGFDIDGDDIDTGGSIFAASAEGNIDIDTSSASGDIAFTAAEGNVIGDFAESRFGSITIRASSVDFGELYAAGNIDIAADEDVTLDYAETGGEGGSQDLQPPRGKDLLSGSQCEDCVAAADGDILIVAGDTVALGTLDAFDDIVITAGTLTGATSSLTAGDTLTATIGGNAQFGSLVSGGTMALTAGGTATGQSAQTNGSGSGMALSATNGLSVSTVRASGTADLTASAGAVTVANLRAVGLVNASGRSVTVSGGTGLLDFQSLRATAGDARVTVGSGDLVVRSGTATGTLALTTQNGAIETRGVQGGTVTIDSSRGATLNNATTATGALGVTARNTATINGVASGGSVRITSGDIVIASGARVGTGGTTTDVLLINGDGTRRTFVGGTGSTAGYSLSAEEMSRVFGGNITIRAPRVSINEGLVASAPGTSIIAPSGEPDLVIDAFSINGGGSATGNLGSAGILRIETPGFARVVGAAQVTNATPNNSFVVSADRSLQVILGSGSLRINGGSGLVGALRLISEDVVVATASAIADIAATTDMAVIDDRLASNDGVLSDEGALSGGTIRFEVGRGLYIQNSGNGDGFDDRRGFTAGTGGVSIFTGESSSTTGGGTARLVINGRTTSEAGEILTGIDAFTRISVNQTLLTGDSQIVNGLDAGSTINGCLVVSASNCFAFELDLIPPIQDNPLVDFDDEESEQTDGSDPLNLTTIVEIEDVDRMSNEPVVDEPVTGSGNDDLWTPPDDDEEDE